MFNGLRIGAFCASFSGIHWRVAPPAPELAGIDRPAAVPESPTMRPSGNTDNTTNRAVEPGEPIRFVPGGLSVGQPS
jgi:hypothetical protein